MAIGDIVRIAVQNEDSPQNDFVNVFHYRNTVGQSLNKSVLEAAVLGWMNEVYPLYADCISDQIGLRRVTARFVPPTPEEYQFLGTGEAGTQTGIAASNVVAPIVSWRSGLIGRSYRGRTYMPACSAANAPGPNLTSAQLAFMDTFAQKAYNFTDIINGNGGWQLIIWSTKLQQETAEVNSHLVPTSPGTLRSRRGGVGS